MKDTKIISEANSFRLGYRGDIEGLRAVAVLLVIVTHAGVPWIRGGFIGVDVFFVLSGYLITGLLLQEIKETGEIKFLKFYARRLKRLLPALLFMVILTSFLAALLFAPLEQLSHVAAARTASVWFSNIYFAITNFGYFDKSVDENLFLHTWSLGVEEQFYLVWPVLIMFLLGAWKWQGVKQDLSRLFYGMIATIGLFLVFSVILSYTLPLWGFYSMPSRAWQFALGAIVLLWTTQKGKNISSISSLHISQKTSLVFSIGGWAGIVLILASAFILGPNKTYPGLWALMPSVGAALVLVAGSSDHSTSITKLLSVSPMQWVGRLSYSWYLWHWPMLILGGVFFINNEQLQQSHASFGFFLNAPGETLVGLVQTLFFYLKLKCILRGRGGSGVSWIRIEPDTGILKIAVENGILKSGTDLLPDKEIDLKDLFYSQPPLCYIDSFLLATLRALIGTKKLIKKLLKKEGL